MIAAGLSAAAPTVDPCKLSPVGCVIKDKAGDAVGAAADNFMTRLIDATADGLIDLIGNMALSMFVVPSPTVGTVGGGQVTPSGTLQQVYGATSWLVMAVAVVSVMVTIMRMFWTLQASEGQNILRLLFNVIASTTVVIGMTVMLIQFGDRFSPWALMKIGGLSESEYAGLSQDQAFAKRLIGLDPGGGAQALGNLSLVALVMLTLTTIGVMMQWIFLIVRAPVVIVMTAFIPLFAAASGTRQGQERLMKSLMFLLAFVLYKPVAAIIYGVGLRLMSAEEQTDDPLFQFLWGSMLILMAALALPAMIKLFVPEAAVGSSSAFSGAAGVAAAGAAVYGSAMLAGALATGGASAGAAGAGSAGAGAGAGGAGATGAGSPPLSGGPPGGGGAGGGGFPGTGGGGSGAGADASSGGSSTGASQSEAPSVAGSSTGQKDGSSSTATGGASSGGASSAGTGGQSSEMGGSVEPPESTSSTSAPEPARGAGGGEGAPATSAGAATHAPAATTAPPVRQVGSRARARQAREALRHAGSGAAHASDRVARGASDMGQPALTPEQRR